MTNYCPFYNSLAPLCPENMKIERRVVADPHRDRDLSPASNCLTDSGMDRRDPHNYWVGKARQQSHFVIDIGCSASVKDKEVHLRNSFNGASKNRS